MESPGKIKTEVISVVQKRKIWQIICLMLAAWGVIKIFPGVWANILMLWFKLKANNLSNEAYSVGIIGGADGPTAIFVTSPAWVHFVIPVLAIVVGTAGYLRLRKQK